MAEEPVATPARRELPGYWHFAWMFFMQPVTLHRWLKAVGIGDPSVSGWRLFKQRKAMLDEGYQTYLWRLVFLLAGSMLILTLVLGAAGALLGLEVRWAKFVVGVAGGVAVGIAFGVAVSLAWGAAVGVAVGLVWGAAVGVAGGVIVGVAVGVAVGSAWGAGLSVAGGVAGGVAFDFALGVALGVVFGVAESVEKGGAFLLMTYRLPLFPGEALLATACFLAAGDRPERTLQYHPVLFHNLSYLPFPFLARHIVAAAERAPELTEQVIVAAFITPGQRKAAQRALSELQAKELTELAQSSNFTAVANLQGRWLLGTESNNPLHKGFSEVARFILAAEGALSPHIRLQHLDDALVRLDNLEKRLIAEGSEFDAFLHDTLGKWREVVTARHQTARDEAAQQIPNPYIAGPPLAPDGKWNMMVFRGRVATVQHVENLLADSASSASLALIGPRRCGKTSLLNMLPVMLPDTLVVVFDLQDNPAATPEALYRALARRAREQALRERQVDLPDLPEGAPIEALGQWLELLENLGTAACFSGQPHDGEERPVSRADQPASPFAKGGLRGISTVEEMPPPSKSPLAPLFQRGEAQRPFAVKRILICIDEFERLENLFPGEPRELLQFMGLLRATIQHRRRVRLLVSGAAPSDEMSKLWNDHFINLREINIGFLDRPTTLDLLTQPLDEFPKDAIPLQVAEAVYRRCGGQPYLAQFFGWHLVDRLNVEERRVATLDDVAAAEEKILEEANGYFSDTWNTAKEDERAVLAALAEERPTEIDPCCRRRLARRLLIDAEDKLAVPLFGRWLRERRL